ncbi:MAG TPA: hypothetical protein VFS21_16000 [Roseiflexaceae bacterium]|nr:hypothetical protein [Roseiflexaceae bacterium]
MPRRVPAADAHGIRLYDRLRQLDPTMPELPVIVADEIARQIDALPDTGGASPPASSYGVVVPPFEQFFVEADVELPDLGKVQRAVWVRDLTAEWRAGGLAPALRQRAPAGTHWLVSATGYLYGAATQGVLYGYQGIMLFHLDDRGHLLDDTEHVQVVSLPNQQPDPLLLPGDGLPNHAPYLLKAISAMHQRCAADKVTPLREDRRRAEREGVQELHDYYILRVQPRLAPQSMAEVGQPTKGQQPKREHIVRGHFRIYGENSPGLFGKFRNKTIWIPEHERGDSDIGRIQKDYEVG